MSDKVNGGDPLKISARVWNGFVEASDAHRQRAKMGLPGGRVRTFAPECSIKIQNDSGGDLEAGDVLEIGSTLLTAPERRALWFSGDASTGEPKFSVLTEAIPYGAIGNAQAAGVCLCKVDIDDTSHKYAEVTSGQTHLTSVASGGDAVILWQPGSTGVQECVVRIDRGGSSGPPTCVLYQFEGYKDTGVSTGTTLAWSDTVKIACFPQRSLGDVSGCGLSIVTSPSAYTDYAFTTTTGGLYLFQFVAHPIDNTSYGSLYVQRTTSGGHTVNVPHGYWSTRTTIRVQYRNSGDTESDWIDAAYANGPSIVLPSDGMTQYPRYNAVVAQGVASLPANAELCVRMLSGLSAPTGGTGQPTAGGCTFNAANTADTMNLVITRLGAEESELSY